MDCLKLTILKEEKNCSKEKYLIVFYIETNADLFDYLLNVHFCFKNRH